MSHSFSSAAVPTALLLLPLLSLIGPGLALGLNASDPTSVSQTAAAIASSFFKDFYNASATSGDFNQPKPWFWWLSGSGWNGLLDYTIYTNDTQYEAALVDALTENLGANFDFAPAEQRHWEANDDQMYWVYNALTALEYNLRPPANGTVSWLEVAENAFNRFASRWAAEASATCNGGLKWQYRKSKPGYYYKNTVTNGGFLQTAARLARYTHNATYADWAAKIWDWSAAVGLIGSDGNIFDGTWDKDGENCSIVNRDQWSYNLASYLMGTANMYAYMGTSDMAQLQVVWGTRAQRLVAAAEATFFSPPTGNATGVMYESNCEMTSECSHDQTSLKSSLARWMGKTAVLVPSVRERIMGLLHTSAVAAAGSCTNPTSDTVACGMKWWTANGFDGYHDFGTQLSALEAVQALMVGSAPELATRVGAVL